MPPKSSLIFPFVIISLITGIAGGWVRLGWTEIIISEAAATHGLLMTGGFLGSLIALERSIVMKGKAWFLVPLLGVLAAPLFIAGFYQAALYSLMLSSVGLVLILYIQALKYKLPEQWLLLVGSICWLIGNILVIKTGFIPMASPWWIAFILWTIVGERLELTKFLPNPNWSRYLLYGLLGLFIIGILSPFHSYGNWVMGIASVLIGLWLLKFDMARISMKKTLHHRYIGVGLMTGYIWLIFFGVILCFLKFHPSFYDLFLHTFFLGFAFSMIWAHAPIILPMVLKVRHTLYHPVLWIGWVFFQLTLLGRMLFALANEAVGRKWFGVVNGWLIIVMFALMALLMILHIRKSRKKSSVV